MHISNWINYHLTLLVIISLLLFGYASDDNGIETQTDNGLMVTGQALLGPLTGAVVNIYHFNDLQTPVYTTYTSESTNLPEAGLFEIPRGLLADEGLYVITITGGLDIDKNDDNVLDNRPTVNQGILHLVATGNQLKAQVILRRIY